MGIEAQCFKEKKKIMIKNPVFEINAIGRAAARGECPSCGGKVYVLLKSEQVPPELRAKMPAKKSAVKPAKKSAKKGGASGKSSSGKSSAKKSAKRPSKKSC
jgi:hypothetical protein